MTPLQNYVNYLKYIKQILKQHSFSSKALTRLFVTFNNHCRTKFAHFYIGLPYTAYGMLFNHYVSGHVLNDVLHSGIAGLSKSIGRPVPTGYVKAIPDVQAKQIVKAFKLILNGSTFNNLDALYYADGNDWYPDHRFTTVKRVSAKDLVKDIDSAIMLVSSQKVQKAISNYIHYSDMLNDLSTSSKPNPSLSSTDSSLKYKYRLSHLQRDQPLCEIFSDNHDLRDTLSEYKHLLNKLWHDHQKQTEQPIIESDDRTFCDCYLKIHYIAKDCDKQLFNNILKLIKEAS